jgi:phospholipase C
MFSRVAPAVVSLFVLAAFAGACGSDPAPTDDGSGPSSDTNPTTPSGSSGTAPTPSGTGTTPTPPATGRVLKTVFVILMENHSWSTIKASSSAKYINDTLLKDGAHADNYSTPPGIHPSEPNYIWLEAGDNLGITTDDDPAKNHQPATTDHLTAQLEKAGITWKAYVESIDGKSCPLVSKGLFGAKHTPQLFFDDVTDKNSKTSQHCIDHIRPYTELATDLAANKAPQFVFITPNLCDDMHGETFGTSCQALVSDMIQLGDTWLSTEVPKIQGSQAYKNGGALFIVWDEGDESLGSEASDGPIPMFVVSPYAKPGYAAPTAFTHSSMLRTWETIFGVPFLRGAQTAKDLSEMFTSFP